MVQRIQRTESQLNVGLHRLPAVVGLSFAAFAVASCTTTSGSSKSTSGMLGWLTAGGSIQTASADKTQSGRVKVVKPVSDEDRLVSGRSAGPGEGRRVSEVRSGADGKQVAGTDEKSKSGVTVPTHVAGPVTTKADSKGGAKKGAGKQVAEYTLASTQQPTKSQKSKQLAEARKSRRVSWRKYRSDGVRNLRAAVLRASKLHPSVKAAWSRFASARSRSRVERGGLFPVVGVSGSTGGQYYSSASTRSTGRSSRFLWRSEATAVATQLIYDGFSTWNRFKQARNNAVAARFRVENAKQEVALAAVAAYVDVRRNRHLVSIARRNVSVHRAIVGGVSQLTQQGRADQADVSQATGRLALALSNLELRVGQLRDAEARFVAVLGVTPGRLSKVGTPVGLRGIGVRKALQVAKKYNPLIRIARSEVTARRHGVKATDGLFQPKLEVELSGRTGHNLDGVRGRTDDLRALLKLTWNLYRGGSDIARRSEAVANLAAAQHDEAEARRAVRERVLRAYAILSSNVRRLRPLRLRLSASRRVVGAYSEQFRLGRRSLLDRLDAQNELFVAQAEHADITYTVLFNYYTLLAATGQLLQAFDAE